MTFLVVVSLLLSICAIVYWTEKNKKKFIEDGILSTYSNDNTPSNIHLLKSKSTIKELCEMIETKTGRNYSNYIKTLFQGKISDDIKDMRIDALIHKYKHDKGTYKIMMQQKHNEMIIKYYAISQWIYSANPETLPAFLQFLNSQLNYEYPATCKEKIDSELSVMSY